jgi:hypothetical protein
MNIFHRTREYWEEWLSDITTKEDKLLILKELRDKWHAPEDLITKVSSYCDQDNEESKFEIAKSISKFVESSRA